jgi:PAS domain S-box-containing protein
MTILKSTLLIRWNDIIKRFLIIFLPLAFFFGSLTVLFYYRDVTTAKLAIEKSELYKVNSQIKTVFSKFESITSDLHFLARQKALATYLQNPDSIRLHALADDLLIFQESKKIYNSIQFIDEHGRETVLVDTENDYPLVAPDDALQNKAEQTYFKATMKLGPDRVYISPFTVNGNTSGDKAVQPVIRFSMPVVDNGGERRGIIVLTHPITRLIEDLQTTSSSSPGQTILATPNGNYLNSITPDQGSTNPRYESSSTIDDILSKEWQQIQKTEHGQFTSAKGLITFNTVHPYQMTATSSTLTATASDRVIHDSDSYLWKTISFVPQKVLAKWPEKILGRILLLYSVCLFIIAISSFMLARTSVRRRRAEKAMRENEEELRAINEAAANAIIAIDSQKNILHWNPAAERLFQYSATEVVDKPITSIISPPKHQSTFTKISKKFKLPSDSDGMAAKTIELYGYKKDGTEFPVEVSFSAFKKGDQWHTVGIIRDISLRKKMEKEVLRANKFESLGVLSSGIAHDFNNLLTAIIGNINLVSRLSGTPPDSRGLLKNAEKAAHRAKALTQQLLTFSKEGMPIRKTTSVEGLLRDSVEYALHGSPVSSSFDIAADLLLVDIDAGQIGQVIQNIVTNGRQAIRGSGAIHINCRNVEAEQTEALPAHLKGHYIEIAIRDSGHGISQRDQKKIFEPYFTTKDHGSGLGLTIAHSIIQRHDGYITVDSEEDRGSTFTVYLPASVDQHLPQKKEKRRGKSRSFKILVVDNEEMLLNIAGRMLVHLGHECVCAKTAREALDIYKHLWKTGTPVDGVIVDLTLPGGMGGKETAGALFDINSEARIIVASGYSNDPVMVDFDEYGFCAAIAKPFDMDELAEVIEEVLE